MADLKISQLDELFNPYSSDVLPVVHNGITKKITFNTLSTFLTSSSYVAVSSNSQTLLFDENVKQLSISNGNTVSLSAFGTGLDTEVRSLTGNWESTYTTVKNVSGSWSTGLQKIYQNANFNAKKGETYLVDTTTSSITATLPTSPNVGDWLAFQDSKLIWKINNFVINSNMDKIQFLNEPLRCDLNGLYFSLTYFGNTNGWRID